eukprot:Protomagalhaensia_wolfi_Nauph_80__1620@NODE_1_length_8074_cov_174_317237_g0_i0_p8_GENE_NODE_1_length_8074_cov_174_317237_g0_i0NODE_1_length_8074_cov_174_317237_g0_i0_p8_ORF_typecomplete_len166_score21_42Ribosomal_L7Ae/PF01248_26/1e20DUF5394/PF17372_2/0_058DUF5394/PF17372_2/2_5e03_NODE_1_length_8074_cov_174_317237_g0_i049725469
MGKHKVEDEKCEVPPQEYVSPIAKPLFDGKLLERSIKLIRKALEEEKSLKEKKEENAKTLRLVRRGVVEVTKSIRKGETGVVFLASDVYPIDIIAHLPVLCEEKAIAYGYLGSKDKLGAACRSKRPTAVLMLCLEGDVSKAVSDDLSTLYSKVEKDARKNNPYLQ